MYFTEEIIIDKQQEYQNILDVYNAILNAAPEHSRQYLNPSDCLSIQDEIKDTRRQLKGLLAQLEHVSALAESGGVDEVKNHYSQKQFDITERERQDQASSVEDSEL